MNNSDKRYYNFADDLEACPDAWCYVIFGGRKRGKTYSSLSYYLDRKEVVSFLKRTNDDVKLLCSGNSLVSKTGEYEIDTSPYKSINRDRGTKIKAYQIDKGIGAFYQAGDEGQATGRPIGYLLSLNANKKVKGVDLSECEAVIFDECAPMLGERTSRTEGEQVLDLYETVSRDRIDRGRGDLKLILLSNAVDVYVPTCAALEIVDEMVDMIAKKEEMRYLKDRGIFIHLVPEGIAMHASNERSGIYRAMKDTAWGRMSFGNEFAYNDFSRVRKVPLKGYVVRCSFSWKRKTYFVYQGPAGEYYASLSPQKTDRSYVLEQEYDAKSFYYDFVLPVTVAGMENRAYFQTYVLYDLFINFKKRFKV